MFSFNENSKAFRIIPMNNVESIIKNISIVGHCSTGIINKHYIIVEEIS